MSVSHLVLLAAIMQAPAPESPTQRDARMAWWRDAQFGMFIHWGAYAVPAGTYNGEREPTSRSPTTRNTSTASTPPGSTRTSGCASPRTPA